MTNLDSILKSRDITLPTKVHLVKAMVLPEVMYGYESWTVKKAESWRIDAFELWCWSRLLRVPWTVACQAPLSWDSPGRNTGVGSHFLLHWKRPWCWERLKAGGEGDNRGWDGWMVSLTQWTWIWANFRRWWRTGKPDVLQSMGSQRVRPDWATELNWTTFSGLPAQWVKTPPAMREKQKTYVRSLGR